MHTALEWTVRLSILGNAVLFVVLVGGSHVTAPEDADQIAPHRPVHLARQLGALLNQEPYRGEIDAAQQAWDDAVYKGVGGNIIIYQGPTSNGLPFDGVIVSMGQAGEENVTFKAHNGQTNTVRVGGETLLDENTGEPLLAVTLTASAASSGVNQVMKVINLNEDLYPGLLAGNRWQVATHELGHMLTLEDHDDPYDGIMDDTCCDTFPGDYIIQNYTSSNYPFLFPFIKLFPDEASCVRLQFNVPGKQGCAPAP